MANEEQGCAARCGTAALDPQKVRLLRARGSARGPLRALALSHTHRFRSDARRASPFTRRSAEGRGTCGVRAALFGGLLFELWLERDSLTGEEVTKKKVVLHSVSSALA